MTREEALSKVKGYLTDIIPLEEYDEVEEIIKALEQESCEDCISRQAVDKFKSDIMSWINSSNRGSADYFIVDKVEELVKDFNPPSAQPKAKTGHWIYDDECKEHGHCSECGHGSIDLVDGAPHNFCQKCGAKMESEELQQGIDHADAPTLRSAT